MLRSAEQSSTGISCTENSIYKAYLNSIEEAEHFIYIEVCAKTIDRIYNDTLPQNQFFVSTVKKDKRMKGKQLMRESKSVIIFSDNRSH